MKLQPFFLTLSTLVVALASAALLVTTPSGVHGVQASLTVQHGGVLASSTEVQS